MQEAYQEAKAKHPKLQAGIHELEAACRVRTGSHLLIIASTEATFHYQLMA